MFCGLFFSYSLGAPVLRVGRPTPGREFKVYIVSCVRNVLDIPLNTLQRVIVGTLNLRCCFVECEETASVTRNVLDVATTMDCPQI